MDNICPRCGAHSETPVDCSECGALIDAHVDSQNNINPAMRKQVSSTPVEETACPVCHEPRLGMANFCDNCMYDYRLHKPFGQTLQDVEISPVSIVNPVDTNIPNVTIDDSTNNSKWDVIVKVDKALYPPDLRDSADIRDRIFPILGDEIIIGRKTNGNLGHDDILIADPGISKRHARINRLTDGKITIIDLNSTNGTLVNNIALEANIPSPLIEGDEVNIGAYTQISIKGR